jgi:lantibiotic modifying enzyme
VLWAGGAADIVSAGCDLLLDDADETEAGLDWGMVPHAPSRGPNFSHGTAGVASALAIAGTGLGRADLVAAAVRGAEHLLSVGQLDEHGFVVPHTIPPSHREVEPVTYTWCNGAAGTALLFAALSRAGVAEVGGYPTTWLRQRCFDAILAAGVPQRLRPGFWDNDGRCCGTAGVGDVLLDAYQDAAGQDRAEWLLGAASKMADALVERADRDDAGARWRFVEYRIAKPLLPPGTSWMQGSAGIAAFLFRMARVLEEGPATPVVDRPDQWWAVPHEITTSGAPPL